MIELALSPVEQALTRLVMRQLEQEKAEAEARAVRALQPVLDAHGVAAGERFRFEPTGADVPRVYVLVLDRAAEERAAA